MFAPLDDLADARGLRPANVTDPQIRPSDGAVVYLDSDGGIRIWQEDAWAVGSVGEWSVGNDPTANDPLVETWCAAPLSLAINPQDSTIVYACEDASALSVCPNGSTPCGYHTDTGAGFPVAPDHYLVHLGFDGNALVQSTAADGALSIQDSDGWTTALSPDGTAGVPTRADAVRATADGFYVLDRSGDETVSLGDLWLVDYDGTCTRQGRYPPPAADTYAYGEPWPCKLGPDLKAYCLGYWIAAGATQVADYFYVFELDAFQATRIWDRETSQDLVPTEWSVAVVSP